MHRSAVLLVCALTSASALAPLRAQAFDDNLSVTAIEIPVLVLRDGEAVDGLQAADFVVSIDGAPVAVEALEVLRSMTVRTQVGERATTPHPADAPPPRPRHLLLFFDLLFTERRYMQRAVDGARVMVADQLPAGDRVAVAVLSASGARLVAGFTGDREEVGLAIDVVDALMDQSNRKVRQSAARLQRYLASQGRSSGLADLSARFGSTAAVAIGPGLGTLATSLDGLAMVRADPRDTSPSIDPVIDAVTPRTPEQIGTILEQASYGSMIRTLAQEVERLATLLQGVPNPKEVLYFSEGFDSTVLDGAAGSPGLPRPADLRPAALRHLGQMHAALVRAGWTLHGIDVAGVPATGGVGTTTPRAPDAPPGPQAGFDALALFFMANETGGQVLENYNRIEEATERLLQRTRVSYLLTVVAGQMPRDGRRHQIEVELRQGLPRAQVHHRPAYYAPKPDAEMVGVERELDLMQRLLRGEEENLLAASVHAGLVTGSGAGSTARFAVAIPATAFSGAIGRERQIPVDVQVFALDAGGGALTAWSRRLTLDLDKVGTRIADGGLRLTGVLAASAGIHSLRMLVRLPDGEFSMLSLPIAGPWQAPSWPAPRGLVLDAG